MIQLLFIRHGATEGNINKRYIGRTDEPLSNIGVQQIEKLKNHKFQIDKLFVSPMLRTKQSAEILFPDLNYKIIEDFRETDFGIFEGKNAYELSKNQDYQVWIDSFCQDPIPNGESVVQFKTRCCRAFQNLMSKIEEQTSVALVVHGGTIMAILEAFAEPPRDFYNYHVDNGAWVIYKLENGILHR